MSVLKLLASDNYIVVNKDLIKILNLEGAVMFGQLASEYVYWENARKLEDGYFYSTIEDIQEKTSLTAYQQRNVIKMLEEKNLINVKLMGMPAKRYIKINENQVIKILNNKMLKNFTTRCEKTSQQDVKKFNINNNINNNKINNNKYIYSLFDEIIDYLNEKTGKHYRSSTPKTKTLINARLKEGFVLEDFKQVIDNKVNEWINDKKMNQYLRPETLFGTKFEGYLNQEQKSITTKDLAKNMDFSDVL